MTLLVLSLDLLRMHTMHIQVLHTSLWWSSIIHRILVTFVTLDLFLHSCIQQQSKNIVNSVLSSVFLIAAVVF